MATRWTEENTLKFVKAYRDRECLWKTTSGVYRNQQAREESYKELEEIMGIEGFGRDAIKNKIRVLRSTYAQEKKKIRDSKKAGKKGDDVYVPRLLWFKLMYEFLHCVENNKSKREGGSKISRPSYESEDSNNTEEPVKPKKLLTVEKRERSLSIEPETLQDPINTNNFCNVIQDTSIRDECSVFGEHIAFRLRSITDRQTRLLAEHKIHTVLFEIEMEKFKETEVNYSLGFN